MAVAGVAAGVLAVLGGLTWLLLFSTVLGVRTIEVSGATITNADDVRRLADVSPGTPLARIDLDAVATRVAGLPAVDTVTVSRVWPGTIDIRIVERTPLFAIETPAGTGSPTTRGSSSTLPLTHPRA